MCDLIINILHV